MRPEFYETYRDLTELYRLSQYDLRFARRPLSFGQDVRDLRIVDDAITEEVADMGLVRTLRPDARLFLLVNLHQMLALPLAYTEVVRREHGMLDAIVRSDVRTILNATLEESRGEEISGHAVLNAVSRVWRRLRATEIDVWG